MSTPTKLTFIADWNRQLRMLRELRRFQAPGVGSSFPLLVLLEDGLYVTQFYHISEQIGPDTMYIEAPCFQVRLTYPDWKFIDEVETDFGLTPFPAFNYTLSQDERNARRAQLVQLEWLYEEVMMNFPRPPALQKADELIALLKQTTPTMLWPYYQKLIDPFYAWVEQR